MDVLQKLSAADFNIQIDDRMRHAWKMAIKEASRLQEQNTPIGKLQQLQKAIKILAQSFSLFKNEQIAADHLATFIPYVLVKARIDRLLAHHNYIQAFMISSNEGNEISVVNTNLNIAITRLKNKDFDEHIKKVDPDFFEREELSKGRKARLKQFTNESNRNVSRVGREKHQKGGNNEGKFGLKKYVDTRAVRRAVTVYDDEIDVQHQ